VILETTAITDADEVLIAAARQVIAENYEYGRHHIGAAVRMRDGRIFTGGRHPVRDVP
jgi:cytidine deaminase